MNVQSIVAIIGATHLLVVAVSHAWPSEPGSYPFGISCHEFSIMSFHPSDHPEVRFARPAALNPSHGRGRVGPAPRHPNARKQLHRPNTTPIEQTANRLSGGIRFAT
jgi:hypothetical protein